MGKAYFWDCSNDTACKLLGRFKFWSSPDNLYALAGSSGTRVKSTFGNINYFAGYLIVVLPF